MNKIPCVYMRGGTSKACFFRKEDLPKADSERREVLLKIYGSPDPTQIDGMGGATPNTSKAAIISLSDRSDVDIDYDFSQIGIDTPTASHDMNCGNISSAVGPYAIDEGMVEAKEPVTVVRIYNTNTGKIIHSHVPVKNGKMAAEGDYKIAGVPGTSARINLEFFEPQGSVTGVLLPSGSVLDTIEIDGEQYEYSFIDAANPIVFVNAKQFVDDPAVLPDVFNSLPDVVEIRRKLEIIRGTCAITAGLATSLEEAAANSPGLPKLAMCSEPYTYTASSGEEISADDIDITSRFITLKGKMAPAYAVTAGICLGAAAATKGSLVNRIITECGGNLSEIRIGHPSGVMDIEVKTDENGLVTSCTVGRTARRLMDGYVYY